MVAAAVTQGNVLIQNVVSEHLRTVIAKLREMGVKIIEEDEDLRVIGPSELTATDIKTLPHPGYPTDMQSQMMVAMLKAQGTSIRSEEHTSELQSRGQLVCRLLLEKKKN